MLSPPFAPCLICCCCYLPIWLFTQFVWFVIPGLIGCCWLRSPRYSPDTLLPPGRSCCLRCTFIDCVDWCNDYCPLPHLIVFITPYNMRWHLLLRFVAVAFDSSHLPHVTPRLLMPWRIVTFVTVDCCCCRLIWRLDVPGCPRRLVDCVVIPPVVCYLLLTFLLLVDWLLSTLVDSVVVVNSVGWFTLL